MKKNYLLFVFALFLQISLFAQEESAYFEIGKSKNGMDQTIENIKSALTESGFKIIGNYNAAGSADLSVICYTSTQLEKIALDYPDRGALAAALKIGLKKDNNGIKISMLNPMYVFYAYFVDDIEKHEKELRSISESAKKGMEKFGTDFKPFGGTLSKKKLQKYHYKVMMPYFTDAEKLNDFDSFDEGLKTIQANLAGGKAQTSKVYELVYPEKQVAVFGVALQNPENGEAKFLPIIGDDHVSALPYEIILQGKTASILPGRYRIALNWPELTMGTFMKIMSTPGDIKDTLEELTK